MPAIYDLLTMPKTLRLAWSKVKQRNSAAGIDEQTVADFDRDCGRQLQILSDQLKSGNYKPQPYLVVEVPKKKDASEMRKLSMLSVRDKIVQEAIKHLIEPRCERLFLGCSYAFRQGKSTLKAIRRLSAECQKKKYAIALRLDLDNYFDNIDHTILESRLFAICTGCTELVMLIMLIVKIGNVTNGMKWCDITKGIPQGGILSPLLSNLYLHSFDQFMQSMGLPYIRYADDFVILIENEEKVNKVRESVERYLNEKLHLPLNEPEIAFVDHGFEFLGVNVSRTKVCITENKRKVLCERINSLGFTTDGFSKKDARTIDGFQNYYAKLLPQSDLELFDLTLEQRLKNVISTDYALFPSKKSLLNQLCEITFFSESYKKAQKSKINEIVELFAHAKEIEAGKSLAERNKKFIQSRKLEYHRREAESSEVIVNKPGTFVGLTNKGLTVKENGKVIMQQSTANLSHIVVLGKGVSMSSNFLDYCMANNIPVDFFDSHGKHIGSFLSTRFMEATFWEAQSYCKHERRLYIAAMLICGKIRNQLNLVKYFTKYHKNKDKAIQEKLQELQHIDNEYSAFRKKMDYSLPELLQKIVGYESQAAVKYWGCIRLLVSDDKVTFEQRQHKGAKDIFNSMLNYGYSLLYARVWQALLSAQLNPYNSVIHVPDSGKPSLVYDFVEIFRSQAVDRVVVSLVQKHQHLQVDKDGFLTDDTRALLAKSISERFQRYEHYRGEEIKFENIINIQAKALAQTFVGSEPFKPYIAKW